MQVGDRAPEFKLAAPGGKTVSLSDYAGKTVVLYFYPKDETPGCTIEACTFRDQYEDFTAAGAEVIGVSTDSVESHTKFAEHRRLPFVLLSDPDGALAKKYDVKGAFGLIKGRATFVIDKGGVIRQRFDSAIRVKHHVASALDLVKQLQRA